METTLFDKLLGGGLLAGKKTYLAAIGAVVAAVVAYLSGDIGLWPMILTVAGSLGLGSVASKIERLFGGAKPPA
jgi:hypothetical protein